MYSNFEQALNDIYNETIKLGGNDEQAYRAKKAAKKTAWSFCLCFYTVSKEDIEALDDLTLRALSDYAEVEYERIYNEYNEAMIALKRVEDMEVYTQTMYSRRLNRAVNKADNRRKFMAFQQLIQDVRLARLA